MFLLFAASVSYAGEEGCSGHVTGAEAEYKAVNQAKPVCEKTIKSLDSLRKTSKEVNESLKVGGKDIGKFTEDSFTMETSFSTTKEKLRDSVQAMERSKGAIVKGLELGKETAEDASETAKRVGLGHQNLEKEFYSLTDARRKLAVLYQNKANEINALNNSGGDPMGVSIQVNALKAELEKQKARMDEIDGRLKVIQAAVKAHQSAYRDHLKNLESAKKMSERFTQQKKQLESAISGSRAQLAKLDAVKIGSVGEEAKSGVSDNAKGTEAKAPASGEERPAGKPSNLTAEDEKKIKADADGEVMLEAERRGKSLDPTKTPTTGEETSVGKGAVRHAVADTLAAQREAEKNAANAEGIAANTRDRVEKLNELDKKIYDGKAYEDLPPEKAALLEQRQKLYEESLKEPGVGAEFTRLGVKSLKETDAGAAPESVTYTAMGDVAMGPSQKVFSGETPTAEALKAVKEPDYSTDVSRGFEETRNTLAKDVMKTDAVVTAYEENKARIAQSGGEIPNIGAGEFAVLAAPVDPDVQQKMLQAENTSKVLKQDAYSASLAVGANEGLREEFVAGVEAKTRNDKVEKAVELALSPVPLVGSGLELNRTAGEANSATATASRAGYTQATSEAAITKGEAYKDAVTNFQVDAAGSVLGSSWLGKAAKAGDAAVTSTRVAESAAPDLARASRAPAALENAAEMAARSRAARQIDEAVAAANDNYAVANRSGQDLTREIQEANQAASSRAVNQAANDNINGSEHVYRQAERSETLDGPRFSPSSRPDEESLGGGRLGQGARLGEPAKKAEPITTPSRTESWRPAAEAPAPSAAPVAEPKVARPSLDSYEQEKLVAAAKKKLSNADEQKLFGDVVAASPTNKAEVREAFNASAKKQGFHEEDIRRMRMSGAVERMDEANAQYRILEQQAQAEKLARQQRADQIAAINARAATQPEAQFVPKGPSANWARQSDPNPFESVQQRRAAEAYVGHEKTEELIRSSGLKNFQQESRKVVSQDRYGVENTVKESLGLSQGSHDLRQQTANFRTKLDNYEKSLAEEVRNQERARARGQGASSAPAPARTQAPYSTAEINSPVPVTQRQALRDKAGVPEYLTDVAHQDRNTVRAEVYQKAEDDYAYDLGSKSARNWDDAELTKRQQQAMREMEPKVKKFQADLRQAEAKLGERAPASAPERPSLNGHGELPNTTPDIQTAAKALDKQGVRYEVLDENRLRIVPDETTTLGKAAGKIEGKYAGELFVDSRLVKNNVAASGGKDTIRVNPTLITDSSLAGRLEPTINHEFRHVRNGNRLYENEASKTGKFNWEQTTFGDEAHPTGVRGYNLMGVDEVTASRQSYNTARFEAAAANKAGNTAGAQAKSAVADFSHQNTAGFTGAARNFTRQAEEKIASLENKALTSSVKQESKVLSVREIKPIDGSSASVRVESYRFFNGSTQTNLVVDVKNPVGHTVPMRMNVPDEVAKLGDAEVIKRAKEYAAETGKKLETHQRLLAQKGKSSSPALVGERSLAAQTDFTPRALQEIADRRVNWVLKEHSEFSAITAADNRKFMDLAAKAQKGEADTAFFVRENAVLKRLNDEVVLDKDVVTAMNNLDNEIFLREVEKNPLLKKSLAGKYYDYKSVGLALKNNTPEVRAQLAKVEKKVNEAFDDFLTKVEKAKGWKEKSLGLANDMRTWHQSGIGSTFQEAGLGARRARELALSTGEARLVNFAEESSHYVAATDRMAARSDDLGKKFKSHGFLEKTPNGTALSEDAIETIRKAKPLGKTEADMNKAVSEALGKRYGKEISQEDAALLRAQLKDIDAVNPSLLIERRVEINMGLHDEGLVSFDFKGQNSRNLYQTQMAVLKTKGKDMKARLDAIAEGDRIATAQLDDMKARVEKAVSSLGEKYVGKDVKKVVQKSGDDGIFHPLAELGPVEKAKLAKALDEQKVGDSVRLTYLPKNYRNSDELIPVAERNRLVVEAEKIEKDLFTEHLVGKVPDDVLKGLQAKVDLTPAKEGKSAVGITLSHSSGKAIPAEAEEIARNMLKDKYDIAYVRRGQSAGPSRVVASGRSVESSYAPIGATKEVDSSKVFTATQKEAAQLEKMGAKVSRTEMDTLLKEVKQDDWEGSLKIKPMRYTDGAQRPYYGEVLRIDLLPPPKARGSGSSLALTHPEMGAYLKQMRQMGYDLVVDSSQRHVGAFGYFSDARRVISISPDSTWATFIHEFQHLEFFEKIMKQNALREFEMIRLVDKEDLLTSLNPEYVKYVGADKIRQIQSLLDRGITPELAINESLSGAAELKALGWKRYIPGGNGWAAHRYMLRHQITELENLGPFMTEQQEKLVRANKIKHTASQVAEIGALTTAGAAGVYGAYKLYSSLSSDEVKQVLYDPKGNMFVQMKDGSVRVVNPKK